MIIPILSIVTPIRMDPVLALLSFAIFFLLVLILLIITVVRFFSRIAKKDYDQELIDFIEELSEEDWKDR